MPDFTIPIADTHPQQHVMEHEVLLSFNEDQQAVIFLDWLYDHWDMFLEWYEEAAE